MITALMRREFRVAARLEEEITAAASGLGDDVERVHWLPGLTLVLDDEPLVVLDH
jgi:hypothetical protein